MSPFDSIAKQTQQLFVKYESVLSTSAILGEQLYQQFNQWRAETAAVLERDFPLAGQQQQLDDWQQQLLSGAVHKPFLEQGIKTFGALCKAIGHPANLAFWQAQLDEQPTKEGESGEPQWSVSSQLLAVQWQKVLDKARNEWELALIAEQHQLLLARMEQLLSMFQQLAPVLEALGLDPGLFIDLSQGQLSEQDWAQFQRWASYLANDKGLHALCDLLGKIRQIELSEKIERVKVNHVLDLCLPDINSREEIVGIRLGRDLEHVLPSEKALLADDETALLFDLKFVESRLMSFDMAGMQTQHLHVEREEERQVNEEEKRGPMILCVDTSGSMSGAPETIAKAMTLFLATKAREEQRPCYLINFSTGIRTLELSGKWGLASIIDFLKMSFHGGTDAAPALGHALKTMAAETYQKADLLMISDFIMADLPPETLANIEQQRGKGNRFYSLVVGSAYMVQRLKRLFDHEWVYNPTTSTIHELIGFQQKIDNQFEASPL